ncbi:DUF86 domain-containing protein [Patescibacteria group bacterium]|nr:DUF86 domain-containing protein [Patescibacteria group bacterium]
MSSTEEITIRLKKLKEYLSIVKKIRDTGTRGDIKKDPVLRGALERYLQLIAEASIDIGEIIIADLELRTPQFNRDVFVILSEKKIVKKDLANRLGAMAQFRNILVHDYVEVDLDKVFAYLNTDLRDVDEFITVIARFIKKHE